MNHIVINIIKWTFLVVGLVTLLGGVAAGGEAAIVLMILGVVFAAIGGGIIGYGVWSKKEEAFLRQHGQLIQAGFQEVEINEAVEVNGANPFRIVARWHDTNTNELFVFKSANLWFDPVEFIGDRTIPVYVDPAKPTRYHVDLSFLPKVRS